MRRRAGNGRRRRPLRRHDQPAYARGEWPRHGGPRRRHDRRRGVRAVPSHRHRCRPRSGAAGDGSAARRRRDPGQRARRALHGGASIRAPSSRRATSSPAAYSPRLPPAAAHFSIAAQAIGDRFAEGLPHRVRAVPEGRHRSVARADPGRAGGALPHGRHRHRCARALQRAGPVGGRRGRLDRPARRQPAGLEFAARGGGVRRPRRARHPQPRPQRGRRERVELQRVADNSADHSATRGPAVARLRGR